MGRTRVHLISFYTDDWEYPEHAKRLRGECKALKIPHRIEQLPSQGYIDNTLMKPTFIRAKLDEVGPVLWLDVDGSVFRTFDHLDEGLDFMSPRAPETSGRVFRVGVMYFNDTAGARRLLDAWAETCQQDPRSQEGADDWAFEFTRRAHWPESVRVGFLPDSYHAILRADHQLPDPRPYAGIRISQSESKKKWHREVRRKRGWNQ